MKDLKIVQRKPHRFERSQTQYLYPILFNPHQHAHQVPRRLILRLFDLENDEFTNLVGRLW